MAWRLKACCICAIGQSASSLSCEYLRISWDLISCQYTIVPLTNCDVIFLIICAIAKRQHPQLIASR